MCALICHFGFWTWEGVEKIALIHDFMDIVIYKYPYVANCL